MRTTLKVTGLIAATAIAAVAGCGSLGSTTGTTAAKQGTPAPYVTPSATPAPVPSPDGTYSGACDYNLNDNLSNYTADAGTATGDITVNNTGNVGTTDRVSITWPQQGYSPLAMTKRIHLAPAATRDIQFHMTLSQDQLSNLQNWQTGHNYADGCTYKVTITGTYGGTS